MLAILEILDQTTLAIPERELSVAGFPLMTPTTWQSGVRARSIAVFSRGLSAHERGKGERGAVAVAEAKKWLVLSLA